MHFGKRCPTVLRVLPLCVFLVSCGIALVIVVALWRVEQKSFRNLFRQQVVRRSAAFEELIGERRRFLPALAALYRDLDPLKPTPREWFLQLTSVIPLHDPPFIVNIPRIALVRGKEERERYEKAKGKSIVYLWNTSQPVAEAPVYFPIIDSAALEVDSVDIGVMPNTRKALEDTWTYGGVHDSKNWSPHYGGTFVSSSFAPIYETPTRPKWATDGEKHRSAVRGFVTIVYSVTRAFPFIIAKFEPLPARVQAFADRSKVDNAPGTEPELLVAEAGAHDEELAEDYREEIVILAVGTPLRLVFTPTKAFVREYLLLYPIVGLPLLVFTLGAIAAGLIWYIVRQIEAVEGARRETEQALLSRNKFLAYLCHELRNPLNSTKGYIEWLREMPLSPEQKECVDGLQTGFEHMLRIVNDTLDLGKLEAGKALFERVQFDMCEVLRTTVTLHKTAADIKGLQLKVTADPNVPCRVYGDPVRLGQVLTNLISNAIKVTEQGVVGIFVSLSQDRSESIAVIPSKSIPIEDAVPIPADSPVLRHGLLKMWPDRDQEGRRRRPAVLNVSVYDHGPGIPVQSLPALFIEYSQPVPVVGKASGTGTGLGLSFVKALVKGWGGEVLVQSKVGVGSCFLVRLPVWIGTGTEHEGAVNLAECLHKTLDTMPRTRLRMLADRRVSLPSVDSILNIPYGHGPHSPPAEATTTVEQKEEKKKEPEKIDVVAVKEQQQQQPQPQRGQPGRQQQRQSEQEELEERAKRAVEIVIAPSIADSASQPLVCSSSASVYSSTSLNALPMANGRTGQPSAQRVLVEEERQPQPQQPQQQQQAGAETKQKDGSTSPNTASFLEENDSMTVQEFLQADAATSAQTASITLSPRSTYSSVSSKVSGSSNGKGNGSGSSDEERKPAVLCVDDNDINLRILSRKLKKLGYRVITASNGKEAVETVRRSGASGINLVVMDLQMPVMNGHEAAKLLRSLGYRIPIVALSGSVTEEERRRCEESGMDGFLAKPLEDAKLKAVLEQFTGRCQLTQCSTCSRPS